MDIRRSRHYLRQSTVVCFLRVHSGRGFTFFGGGTVSGKEPACQWAPRDNADVLFLAKRNHLTFFLSVNQVVMVLHRHELRETVSARDMQESGELPGIHAGGADV